MSAPLVLGLEEKIFCGPEFSLSIISAGVERRFIRRCRYLKKQMSDKCCRRCPALWRIHLLKSSVDLVVQLRPCDLNGGHLFRIAHIKPFIEFVRLIRLSRCHRSLPLGFVRYRTGDGTASSHTVLTRVQLVLT